MNSVVSHLTGHKDDSSIPVIEIENVGSARTKEENKRQVI